MVEELIQILNTKVVNASTSKDEVQDDEKYIRTLGMDEDLVNSIDEEDLQYDIYFNGETHNSFNDLLFISENDRLFF